VICAALRVSTKVGYSVFHFGPPSKFDTVATLGCPFKNGDPSMGPQFGCFGVKLANGWRGIKQALQKRRFINKPSSNDNENLPINNDNAVLGAVTLPLGNYAPCQNQVVADHHAESNLEVERLQNLVAQLELALADARDRTNVDDKGTASAQGRAGAVDLPVRPPTAPLLQDVVRSGARRLSVEKLPVTAHSMANANAAGAGRAEDAPARGGLSHRRKSYHSQGLLFRKSTATRLSQSSSGICVGLARQVVTAAASSGPSSDSTIVTANAASAATGSSASLKHHCQLSQHKTHHLPDQTAQTYDTSTTDALMVHATSCASPVALLVLGVAAGTVLPDLPAVRLPAGDEQHSHEHQLIKGGSKANGPVARQSRSGGIGSRGPPVSGAIADGGGSAVQPPTAITAQPPGQLYPFACVWVNESAQEQLLLEAADEYDSVLAHMSGRDPVLRALLRELARQMAAEAVLPAPLTHLVPGGSSMGLGTRSSSRPQAAAPCTTHPLVSVPAPLPVVRSHSVATANGIGWGTQQRDHHHHHRHHHQQQQQQQQQQQLQKGLPGGSPLFADLHETSLPPPSSARFASAMADEIFNSACSG
ncbi:hypothetical protein Vretifemale_5509, partial [Volvox reticuliferus]